MQRRGSYLLEFLHRAISLLSAVSGERHFSREKCGFVVDRTCADLKADCTRVPVHLFRFLRSGRHSRQWEF